MRHLRLNLGIQRVESFVEVIGLKLIVLLGIAGVVNLLIYAAAGTTAAGAVARTYPIGFCFGFVICNRTTAVVINELSGRFHLLRCRTSRM